MGYRNYIDKLKRYYPFTGKEVSGLILTIIVLTLIVGLDDGSAEFDYASWLANLIKMGLIIILTVLVHHSAQRFWGLKEGYKVETYVWWYGLLFAFAIAIVTRGSVWMLIATGTTIHQMNVHRLGKFRYGPNYKDLASVAFAGPLANIFLATIVMQIGRIVMGTAVYDGWIYEIYIFNLGYAAWNLLPIPPLDGSRIFYNSRLSYVFIAAAFWAYSIMALMHVYSYIFAIIVAVIVWFFYRAAMEK